MFVSLSLDQSKIFEVNFKSPGHIIMDKKIMRIQLMLLLLSLVTSIHSYSQKPYTKEIFWSVSSVEMPVFQNKEQVVEWYEKLSSHKVYLQPIELQTQDNKALVIMRDIYSGRSCMDIGVLKKTEEGFWSYVTGSYECVNLRYMLEVEANDDEQSLLFISGPDVIGRLPYELFEK